MIITIRKRGFTCYSHLNVRVNLSFEIQIKLAQMSVQGGLNEISRILGVLENVYRVPF